MRNPNQTKLNLTYTAMLLAVITINILIILIKDLIRIPKYK